MFDEKVFFQKLNVFAKFNHFTNIFWVKCLAIRLLLVKLIDIYLCNSDFSGFDRDGEHVAFWSLMTIMN